MDQSPTGTHKGRLISGWDYLFSPTNSFVKPPKFLYRRYQLEIWMTQHLFIRGLRLFLTDSTLIGDFKQRLATHLLKN